MNVPGFMSPSPVELLIVIVAGAASLAWWIGVPYMLWLLLKRQSGSRTSASEGVFTEAVVADDGVLRADVPLGPRWAGRTVRVVVEAIDRV